MAKKLTDVREVNENILTVKEFTMIIEDMVSRMRMSYLDALTHYAEINSIEVETVGALVKSSHVLKAKLASESEEMRLIQSSGNKLPI
jgi:hypothetical protein